MDWYYYQGANAAPKHVVRHERYDTPFMQSVTSKSNGGGGTVLRMLMQEERSKSSNSSYPKILDRIMHSSKTKTFLMLLPRFICDFMVTPLCQVGSCISILDNKNTID